MERSDTDLLAAIAAHDNTAFAELYDHQCQWLRAVIKRWLPRGSAADDVLQDVLREVWRTAAHYDCRRGGPRGWLQLLATSCVGKYLRGRRRHPADPLPRRYDAAVAADPGEAMNRDDVAQRVRAAVAQLPPEEAAAVCLAFFQGQTNKQVAQHEGIPISTVKARLRQAKKRLRGLLAGLAEEVGL